MGIEIRGINTTTIRLNNVVNRTNRKVYDLMERAAKDMKRRVELQTHRDTGALESAIRVRRLSRAGINGRTSFEVFIDPNARRTVKTRTGVKRQRVITYARRLENGDWTTNLGPRSRAKDERVRATDPSLKVGIGFMTRSARFINAVYRRKIERAVSQVIRNS